MDCHDDIVVCVSAIIIKLLCVLFSCTASNNNNNNRKQKQQQQQRQPHTRIITLFYDDHYFSSCASWSDQTKPLSRLDLSLHHVFGNCIFLPSLSVTRQRCTVLRNLKTCPSVFNLRFLDLLYVQLGLLLSMPNQQFMLA